MDAREQFFQAADKIGAGTDGWPHLLADPWPAWFLKVVLRFARVFAPELKRDDLYNRPEVFHGLLAGTMVQLVKAVDEIDLAAISDDSPFAFVKTELPKMQHSESAAIDGTRDAANLLPSEQHAEFYAAYGDALKNETASKSIERMGDSPTVKVCLFLLFLRPQIEAGHFRSVSELVELYFKADAALGGHGFPTEAARASFKKTFRKICTECGLQLRGRGRPRKNTPPK